MNMVTSQELDFTGIRLPSAHNGYLIKKLKPHEYQIRDSYIFGSIRHATSLLKNRKALVVESRLTDKAMESNSEQHMTMLLNATRIFLNCTFERFIHETEDIYGNPTFTLEWNKNGLI